MKKIIAISLVAVSALTGCQGFLTEEPILSQSNELTLSTIEGVDKATAGAYAPLGSTSWYGNEFVIMNEMKTANGKKWIGSDWDSGRCLSYYNINFNENSTSSLWSAAYYVISAANNVLANVEGKGTEADVNNLKAEALFLRALAHFDLVRTFAMPYNHTTDASHPGVPVIVEPQAPSATPARAKVSEVYTQIISDLTTAETLIAADYVRGFKDPKASVTKEAIQALLSRAYLYTENWQKAADYAATVINSKKFTLWTAAELKDAACYTVDVPTGGEVIFEIYGDKLNTYDGYHDGLTPMTGPTGYGDAGCSADLIGLYEATDVRSTLFQEEGGCTWTAKYKGKGNGKPDQNNVIVLRLSEMYLNLAEAVANGANGHNGVAALEAIATSRGATAQPCTKEGVYAERNKELAWEAHLWFDLARTGRDMTRVDFIGAEDARTVEAGSYKWAMPIPMRETGVNPNLVQNEGY